jgi:predicted Zn-dependent protease
LSTQSGLVDWYFIYQKKGSGNMMDGYLYGSSPKDSILQSVMAQEEYLKVSDKIEKIQSGKYPVLIVEEKAPLKKILESFHLNKYSDLSALYSGKLNTKLFNDKVTIYDSGYDPTNGQFNFFDGEGVVRTADLKLIDGGIFTSTISDLRFSKKYSEQCTGNGLRVYNRGVNVDFKNLRFKKGIRPWKEIISNLPVCIVAAVCAGGDSNDLGEFSSPVQIGYIYRHGELIGLAPQVTVKTSNEQYLDKNLIDISSDGFTDDHSSGCVISEMDVLLNS